mmetsp:Transcript_20462/g.53518  ORF Transcript_20462/g.53518 Transcript_20462/m.53518 type:complete len:221 (+) Transcript_20462:1029-1691(+)
MPAWRSGTVSCSRRCRARRASGWALCRWPSGWCSCPRWRPLSLMAPAACGRWLRCPSCRVPCTHRCSTSTRCPPPSAASLPTSLTSTRSSTWRAAPQATPAPSRLVRSPITTAPAWRRSVCCCRRRSSRPPLSSRGGSTSTGSANARRACYASAGHRPRRLRPSRRTASRWSAPQPAWPPQREAPTPSVSTTSCEPVTAASTRACRGPGRLPLTADRYVW